jgi:hypothetical protein
MCLIDVDVLVLPWFLRGRKPVSPIPDGPKGSLAKISGPNRFVSPDFLSAGEFKKRKEQCNCEEYPVYWSWKIEGGKAAHGKNIHKK